MDCQFKTHSALNMNTAVILISLAGACLASQVVPVAQYVHPELLVATQPIHQVAQQSVGVVDTRKPIAILSQSFDRKDYGIFSYGFESENGIRASASGSVKALGPKEEIQVVQGSYSYTAPDGTPITRTYVADENGFRAEGADIPTPPPIPEAIAKALEILPMLEKQEQQEKASGKRF